MCFSATASLVAGGTIGVVGVATVRAVKNKSELLFACIPLMFALQQIIEGVVWLSFGEYTIHTVATYVYSVFAFVLWPTFVPLSVWYLEKNKLRRKVLVAFIGVGVSVSTYFVYSIVRYRIVAYVINNCMAYGPSEMYFSGILFLYVCATCISFFVSTHKSINLFGALMLASYLITQYFFAENLTSVWCFFAAILSVVVYAYITRVSVLS